MTISRCLDAISMAGLLRKLVGGEGVVPAPARDRLVAFAYRMLGSRSDAEDVVQEALARMHERNVEAADPARYTFRVVTNLCMDRLRAEKVRRRAYVGPWLPEPWIDDASPQDIVERSESLSIALLVLLERLSAAERVVFVLREAFDLSFDEIAELVDVSSAACRQRYGRAKARLKDRPPIPAPVATQHLLLTKLLGAIAEGELAGVVECLSTDVELVSDGGGVVLAAIRPVPGAQRVAKMLLHIAQRAQAESPLDIRFAAVNGGWGVTLYQRGKPHSCIAIDVHDDRIRRIFIVRNPHKLSSLETSVRTDRVFHGGV